MDSRQPHLKLAHRLWKEHLKEGDWAIDATCGNGHDAYFLSQLKLGQLVCIDIQEKAIEKTREKVPSALFFNQCHSAFPNAAIGPKLKLIVYNLGYLPGSDKSVRTHIATSKSSIERGLELLPNGGAMSITLYPGHAEGLEEKELLLPFLLNLGSEFSLSHYTQDRDLAPELVYILKTC